jgi:hypothetical protein
MTKTSDTSAGWVIADESPTQGRKAPRFYLVAATGPAQALALAQQELGDKAKLIVRGPAEEAHLKRRKMQLGDITEI